MAAIPGSVRLTGFIAPTDSTDTYPVHDAIYGKDGLRSVADTTARDAITSARRRAGMIVFTQADEKYWKLNIDLVSWTELIFSGFDTDIILTETGEVLVDSLTGNVVLEG